jgi:hypothetical protein
MSNVSYPITIINSTINITGDTTVGDVIKTHDISQMINGNTVTFPLIPEPDLNNIFILTLDGLVLTPGQDYFLSGALLTLNFPSPQIGSKLLAFYQDLQNG